MSNRDSVPRIPRSSREEEYLKDQSLKIPEADEEQEDDELKKHKEAPGLDHPPGSVKLEHLEPRLRSFFDSGGDIAGVVPIGTIVSWLPGYFTNTGNVGYNAVAITLPDGFMQCDGSLLTAVKSPLLGGTDRYLPDLDDGRYLRGDTPANAGTPQASASTGRLTSAEIPQHNHGVGTLATSSTTHGHTDDFSNANESSHYHTVRYDETAGAGGLGGGNYLGGRGTVGLGAQAGYDASAALAAIATTSHTHTQNGVVNLETSHTHGVTGSTGNYGTASNSAINPKYLNAVFIMRVR